MATLKILESVKAGPSLAIVAQVSEGAVHPGDILADPSSGFRWQVMGFGFVPPIAHQAGRVALSIQPLDNAPETTAGQLLIVK